MKAPIILRADDGLSWWRDAGALERFVELPEIEEGIYTVWDSEGQALDLSPATQDVRKSFLGLRTGSTPEGVITETGRYEPEILHAVIAAHIKDVWKYKGEIPEELCRIVHLLCRLQLVSR
jgi:hypothetical protein